MSSFELQELPIRFKNPIIIPRYIFFQYLGIFFWDSNEDAKQKQNTLKTMNIHLLNRNREIIVSGKIEDIKPNIKHERSTIKFVNNPKVYSGREFDSVRMDQNDAAQIDQAFKDNSSGLFTQDNLVNSLVPSFTEEERHLPLSRLRSTQDVEKENRRAAEREKRGREKRAKREREEKREKRGREEKREWKNLVPDKKELLLHLQKEKKYRCRKKFSHGKNRKVN